MADGDYRRLSAACFCGVEFEPRQAAAKYCSKTCKVRWWRAKNADRAAAYPSYSAPRLLSAYYAAVCACGKPHASRLPWKQCPSCYRAGQKARAHDAHHKAAQALHRAAARETKCDECGAVFCPMYGSSNATLCMCCVPVRAQARKRIEKSVRRARSRGAEAELVDPFKVFDRDRWRCQLCGIKTPKAKRGTCHDTAPELDHIQPISKGGAHTYANTQCACRKCNREKSDRPMGQTMMFG